MTNLGQGINWVHVPRTPQISMLLGKDNALQKILVLRTRTKCIYRKIDYSLNPNQYYEFDLP